jgi:uncharacterized ubiquitin-like protein YukD
MNSTKYIQATIKIPIEIQEDGNYETLPNYMSILFDKLDYLPPLSETDLNNESIKTMIKSILLSSQDDEENYKVTEEKIVEEEKKNVEEGGKNVEEGKKNVETDDPIMITLEEFQQRKPSSYKKNLSFKAYRQKEENNNNLQSSSRFTAKNYGNG